MADRSTVLGLARSYLKTSYPRVVAEYVPHYRTGLTWNWPHQTTCPCCGAEKGLTNVAWKDTERKLSLNACLCATCQHYTVRAEETT